MSQKRKLETITDLKKDENETTKSLNEDEIDTTDEELSDSDFHEDDIDDNFDQLMIDSDGITDDEGNISEDEEEEHDDDGDDAEQWGGAGSHIPDSGNGSVGDEGEYTDIGEWEDDDEDEPEDDSKNGEGGEHSVMLENKDGDSLENPKISLQELLRNVRSVNTHSDEKSTLKSKLNEKYVVVGEKDKKIRNRFLEELNVPKQIMRELQIISYKDPKRRARVINKIRKGEKNNIVSLKKGKKATQGKLDTVSGKTTKSPKLRKGKTKDEGEKATESEIEDDPEADEYEDDSSDEEDLRNTIGNIPINWYDEYPHLGYGLDSLPIMKPETGDTLDKFLNKMENPDYFRTVFDKQTGKEVKLSDNQLDLIQRLLNRKVPNKYHKTYAPFPDLYSHEVMKMPLSGRPEHKRSFIPSKPERTEVLRLARLIERGVELGRRTTNKKRPRYYDIWKPRSKEEPRIRGVLEHIPAPKEYLPGHGRSYNPPPEYLVSKKDELKMAGKFSKNFIESKLFNKFWRKYKSIRDVPVHPTTVTQRFYRLLDLYLCPRKKYQKVTAKAKDFLPDMPEKKDLRPYPTMQELIFTGHESIIRTISMHPSGKYLASGSDDHTVRIWEVSTGRCLRTFKVEEAVKHVSWNPNPKLFLIAIAMGRVVVLLNPETYLTDKIVVQQTNAIFKDKVDQGDFMIHDRIESAITWRLTTEEEYLKGYRVVLDHFSEVSKVVWHRQGDYFASLMPEGKHRSVIMHQLSRWRSQFPFKRNKGRIQCISFHPKKPLFFACTQSHIRVYNLQWQKLIKKIQSNSRWISSIAIHPGGEHFVIGCYDRKVNWFEMECTKRPHLMRYHFHAVRSVNFHRKYPLFATCSDDGRTVVSHATVYDDFLTDPTIVPLKQLKGHIKFDDYYALDLVWHPYEPFLLTAGADATIRLWR